MKNYKEYPMMALGSSDIASLVARGCDNLAEIKMGGDGSYKAHYITEECEIPNHYEKVFECHHWIKIYDDDIMVADIRADKISLYRAGDYGIIIYAIGARLARGQAWYCFSNQENQ